ncbi:MAG: precorrin-6A reductase [Syntrophales bacterium]|nr:precorrin-6A reductase [Syntrophales bacterium]
MILLLGGTSETVLLAMGFARAGYDVLVSTATAIRLDTGEHPGIRRRAGVLNLDDMILLAREHGIRAIIDATHPYATVVRETAKLAAGRLGVPYLTYIRPGEVPRDAGIDYADSHEEAAKAAFSCGRPVLLTTGARHLASYVRESKRVGIPLHVRVLPETGSLSACRSAGIEDSFVIAARGPFSVAENVEIIRSLGIGVVVMKDSGSAGGTKAKLTAAKQENCRIVVVRRPNPPTEDVFDSLDELIRAVAARIPRRDI